MGIRMPKVPQEVPVAKESMADTPNIMAGISITGILDAATTPRHIISGSEQIPANAADRPG